MKTRSLRDKILEKINASESDSRNGGAGGSSGEAPQPRVICRLSARALRKNYQIIQDLNPDLGVIPMVKADAYGHGMLWAARELIPLKQFYALGVATLEEGGALREGLGMRQRKTRIIVFSGAIPWNDEVGAYCEAHGLTPVIAADEDWTRFRAGGWTAKIPYELKFNTGMNRLGISMGALSKVRQDLSKLNAEEHPQGVLTHLAAGEKPDHPLTREQFRRFQSIRAELAEVVPGARFHIANSSAIWNTKHYGLEEISDLVRPGLSLYGVAPWADAPARGLEPVMTLETRVMRIHALKAGESIGYGATYTAAAAQSVAVLPAGYADGWVRCLSNSGRVMLGGNEERVLGIVSMDLSAISATPRTKIGDSVELLGPSLSIWAQAQAAKTIPYELLTSVSARVKRVYED